MKWNMQLSRELALLARTANVRLDQRCDHRAPPNATGTTGIRMKLVRPGALRLKLVLSVAQSSDEPSLSADRATDYNRLSSDQLTNQIE